MFFAVAKGNIFTDFEEYSNYSTNSFPNVTMQEVANIKPKEEFEIFF